MFSRRAALLTLTSSVTAVLAAPRVLRAAEPMADKAKLVKVASIQASSELGDVAGNRKKFTALCEEAAGKGAKIIVLPETAITGYLSQDLKTNWHLKGWPLAKAFPFGKDPQPFAETVPGPSTEHFAALAKRLGAYITVPLLEVVAPPDLRHIENFEPGNRPPQPLPAAPPKYFNTVCLAAPTGKIVAHYRKLTPWPHPEQSWATPGDLGVTPVDTEYGRVGLAICFDIHTILEKYQPHNLWALLYPIAWVDDEHPAEWFFHRLPARVAPFKHYVVGANWAVDAKQAWRGYGFSPILGPKGEVIAAGKSLYGSEIVYADLKSA